MMIFGSVIFLPRMFHMQSESPREHYGGPTGCSGWHSEIWKLGHFWPKMWPKLYWSDVLDGFLHACNILLIHFQVKESFNESSRRKLWLTVYRRRPVCKFVWPLDGFPECFVEKISIEVFTYGNDRPSSEICRRILPTQWNSYFSYAICTWAYGAGIFHRPYIFWHIELSFSIWPVKLSLVVIK